MSTEQLLARRAKAVAKGVSNLGPFFAEKAEGAVITDVEGREFIDFAGGIGVVNVGHNHPKVVAAIKAQADKLLHTCFHVAMYEGYVALCEKLTQLTPGNLRNGLYLSTAAPKLLKMLSKSQGWLLAVREF